MIDNNTVKNSASNSPIKQALQAKSGQLLPVITQALSERAYSKIVHQRISQQYREGSTEQTQESDTQHIRQSRQQNCYQGLTRAQHLQYGRVMIKWEISNASNVPQNISDLNHEISVLQALSVSQKIQATITPSVFDNYNIDIQALGQTQRLTVLVMPHYENSSLAKLLNRQHHPLLTDKQKYHLIIQSAQLILSLHNAGWLHNDIKPSNILLSNIRNISNNPKDNADSDHTAADLLLTDFALAQRIGQPNAINSASGTPAYLAPERWQGKRATVQSDIYAFGILMVEILMGKRPFEITVQSHDPMIDWATQHCQKPTPRLPIQYSHYQFIVDSALAKRVEKRYKAVEEILLDLEELQLKQ